MGLTSTMWTGLSGLFATGTSIGVTSDNISNINTIGHRGNRAQFETVLNRSMIGVGELGGGVRLARIEKMFEQGSIIGSARSTDLAIDGRGFFNVRGRHSGVDGQFFTRAGAFTIDKDGKLVNPEGLFVQGWNADTNGEIGSIKGDLTLSRPLIAPSATTTVDMAVNLNGNPSEPTNVWNVADASGTSNFSTSVTVYDENGMGHDVTMYFNKTGATAWEWHGVVDSADITGVAGTPTEIATGALTFNGGALDTEVTTLNTMTFYATSGPQTVAFDFGASLTTDGDPTGTSGTTGFAVNSATNFVSQDGFAPGEFVDISIGPDGIATGRFSNGQTRALGRVAIADFRNPNDLESVGATLFATTPSSGEASLGFAGVGGRGRIRGSSLEQSNVDLSTEFVRLITDQRAYQAAAKTITTADELLVETVNIKR